MASDFRKRKINLLPEETEIADIPISTTKKEPIHQAKIIKDKPKKSFKRRISSCFFIVLIILFTGTWLVLSADNSSFLSGIKNSYLIRQITHIISSKDKYLEGEKDDRINFVLMGMGGPGHNGPYLTDTMIIASFKPSTREVAIFSLPRDMIVPLTKNDYRKINTIYTLGQNKEENGGGPLVKQVLSETLDMPIHYFAAVDFSGFVEMIDAIGGVEIDVQNSFTDNQFPTADYKTQTIAFEKGLQQMDGLTALRFARSRHGNNGEGSDFARIKRQQMILIAAKEKVTSFNTLINPKKITDLFSLFNRYTTTDIEPWEAVKLVHLAKGMNSENIVAQSIDDRPGGYLKSGYTLEGAYILQPTTGNYDQIKLLVQNIFDLQEVNNENAKIVIQNGTQIPGLALEALNHLDQMNYNVLRYGNATNQDKITTTVYQYTNNKPKTAHSLEVAFQTKVITDIPLEYSNAVITSNWNIVDDDGDYEQLDFLIVLGSDQQFSKDVEIITTIDPSLFNTSTSSTTDAIIEEE